MQGLPHIVFITACSRGEEYGDQRWLDYAPYGKLGNHLLDCKLYT